MTTRVVARFTDGDLSRITVFDLGAGRLQMHYRGRERDRTSEVLTCPLDELFAKLMEQGWRLDPVAPLTAHNPNATAAERLRAWREATEGFEPADPLAWLPRARSS